jgi:hypothetical protein
MNQVEMRTRYTFSRHHETIECEVSTLKDRSFRVVIRYSDRRADAMTFTGVNMMNQHWKRLVNRLRQEHWIGPAVAPEPPL